MPKYKITIDKNRCVGSTLCMMEAPDIFAVDDEHQARVDNPDSDDDEGILAVANACRQNTIVIE